MNPSAGACVSASSSKKKDKTAKKKFTLDKIEENSGSIEISENAVIFKKENIEVGETGVKKLTTGTFLSIIDPNTIQVNESNELGKGASSVVQRAIYTPTSFPIALKVINIMDREKRSQLKNDLKVLLANDSFYLVKYYGAFFYQGCVKLAIELMDRGSLDKLISICRERKKLIPENVICKMAQDIMQGLQYLHKVRHLIHRDLKPANILINSEGSIKLTDFGIVRSLENTNGVCNTYLGTNTHLSPERIKGDDYSYNADIWALGLVIYELATLEFPYSGDVIKIITRIVEENSPSLPNNGYFSKEIIDFVQKCLKKAPKERASITDLILHPWIEKHIDEEVDMVEWLNQVYDSMDLD